MTQGSRPSPLREEEDLEDANLGSQDRVEGPLFPGFSLEEGKKDRVLALRDSSCWERQGEDAAPQTIGMDALKEEQCCYPE